MITLLLGFGAMLFSVLLFLAVWGWVPLTAIFLPIWLMDHRRVSERAARRIGLLVCFGGGAIILIAWHVAAPNWLRSAFPALG